MEKFLHFKHGLLSMFVFLLSVLTLSVQAQDYTVSGVVTGSDKLPVVGATIVAKGTSIGTITNADGSYSINVSKDAVLLFSFVGMKSQEVAVNGRTNIDIVLESDATVINDVVVVGYGVQKRGSITGSVASVRGDVLLQTKTENPQNMLTGRLAGVRVWQKSSEPGSYNNNFDIRGMGSPLVIIDGIPRSVEDFQRMNPGDIEDVSILKDAAAAIYGLRAANGVLLVTSKKGQEGRAKVSYNGSFTFQVPSKMPKLANAFESMTLWNEKAINNVKGGTPVFTEQDFEDFRNGTRRQTDWNSLIFADWSPQTQHDISISGGSKKTQYFVSFGYFYQEGFFRSGDLNYDKFNLRSNINTEIARGLNLELKVNGMLDDRNNPYSDSSDIIRNYWRQGVLFPAYADPECTMLNYEGLDLQENTVAKMTSDISGYRKYHKKNFQSSAALSYDFGELSESLKGLKVRGMLSYDYRMDNNEIFQKEYSLYAYNKDTNTYTQKLYNNSSPNKLTREFYDNQQTLGQITVNYDREFNQHKVGALMGWEAQKIKGDNFYARRELAFSSPYLFNGTDKNQVSGANPGGIYEKAYGALIGRLNYSYADRYLIEAQFRYDGSSQFAKENRWGFFPSVSLGWRLSEEPFFKNSCMSFINQLKFRFSYGEMGDDTGALYDWVMGFTYPSSGGNAENGYFNGYAPGYVFGNQFVLGADPMALPNRSISWYTAKTLNIGVDFEAWNGLLGISFDYFRRRMSGLYSRPTADFPTVIGATAPRVNSDSSQNMGIELEISHRNQVGDFKYSVKGIMTLTRRKHLYAAEHGNYANSYDRWRNDNLTNRYQGVRFGYESAGRYTGWEDIWSYPMFKENHVLPGDYKYMDYNGDGEINGLDEHPFAFDQTPWMNFSLNLSAAWKGLDLNLLFQGSALGSMEYMEPLYKIWGHDGGGALRQFLDRWHPIDTEADPYDPATQWAAGHYAFTGHEPHSNSEFNRVSTSYLRLKSLEIGYTIPKISKLSNMSMRVYFNAYNLFTITGVKFVDPEHPDDNLGRLYPLNRTYTLGLSLSF